MPQSPARSNDSVVADVLAAETCHQDVERARLRAFEEKSDRTPTIRGYSIYHRPHMAHAGKAPLTPLNNVPRKYS